jgi:hypothetical protein
VGCCPIHSWSFAREGNGWVWNFRIDDRLAAGSEPKFGLAESVELNFETLGCLPSHKTSEQKYPLCPANKGAGLYWPQVSLSLFFYFISETEEYVHYIYVQQKGKNSFQSQKEKHTRVTEKGAFCYSNAASMWNPVARCSMLWGIR